MDTRLGKGLGILLFVVTTLLVSLRNLHIEINFKNLKVSSKMSMHRMMSIIVGEGHHFHGYHPRLPPRECHQATKPKCTAETNGPSFPATTMASSLSLSLSRSAVTSYFNSVPCFHGFEKHNAIRISQAAL
jgi:hypothetical protein